MVEPYIIVPKFEPAPHAPASEVAVLPHGNARIQIKREDRVILIRGPRQ